MGKDDNLNAAAFVDPAALIAFLDALRRAGYRFGGAEYIAAQDIIVTLTAHGEQLDRDDHLENVLRPLLCNSPREQEDFGEHFAHWRSRLLPGFVRRTSKPTPAPASHVADEIRTVRKVVARTRWAALALVVVGGALSAWWWYASHRPAMIHVVTEPPGATVWSINRSEPEDTVADDAAVLADSVGTVANASPDSLGSTPVRWLDPQPGTYDLMIRLRGFVDTVHTVTVGREREKDEHITLRSPGQGAVVITGVPVEARIRLQPISSTGDNVQREGGVAETLTEGEYRATISADGYHSESFRLNVRPDSITEHTFVLRERPIGVLEILTDPPTALLNTDRRSERRGPGTFFADTGSIGIHASLDGYADTIVTETVRANDTTYVDIKLLPLPRSLLRVTSRPAGASVIIDGRQAGITAANGLDDSIGVLETEVAQDSLIVRVALDGYEDVVWDTEIETATAELNAVLRRRQQDVGIAFGPAGRIAVGSPDDSILVINTNSDAPPVGMAPGEFTLVRATTAGSTGIDSADAWLQPLVRDVAVDPAGERNIALSSPRVTADIVDLDVYRPGSSSATGSLTTGTSVRTVTFSPDGSMLAYAAADGEVHVLLPSGRPIRAWPLRPDGGDSVVNALTFTHDGDVLAAGGEQLSAWNVATGGALRTPYVYSVFALAADSGGRIAYRASSQAGILDLVGDTLTHVSTSELLDSAVLTRSWITLIINFLALVLPVSIAGWFLVRFIGSRLRGHREVIVPSDMVSLILERVSPQIYEVAVTDQRYFNDSAVWYLGVRSTSKVLGLTVPRVVKVSSPARIEDMIRNAMPGVELRREPAPQTGNQQSGRTRFRMVAGGPVWQDIRDSGAVAIYLPEMVADAELELTIALDSVTVRQPALAPRWQFALAWLTSYLRIAIPTVALLLVNRFLAVEISWLPPFAPLRVVMGIAAVLTWQCIAAVIVLGVTVSLARAALYTPGGPGRAATVKRVPRLLRLSIWSLAILATGLPFAPIIYRLLNPLPPSVLAMPGSFETIASVAIQPDDSGFVEIIGRTTGGIEVGRITALSDSITAATDDPVGNATAVAVQSGTNFLAAGVDSTVYFTTVLDSTSRAMDALHGHLATVSALAFSGNALASGDADGVIRLWRLSDEIAALEQGRHDAAVNTLAWMPSTGQLASGGSDGEIRLWSDSGYGLFARLPSGVQRIAFSDDGALLAAVDADSVRVWSLSPSRFTADEHGEVLSSQSDLDAATMFVQSQGDVGSFLWRVPLGKHGGEVTGLVFSPDGRRLASADDSTVILWDTRSFAQMDELETGTRISGVAFNPRGDRLAAATPDSVVLWDVSGSREATIRDWIWRHVRPILPALLFVVVGLVAVPLVWRWRTKLFMHRRRTSEPPDLMNVTFRGLESPLFTEISLLGVAQRFRRRVEIDSTDLDVLETVRATVGRSGVFTAVMERRQVPPEYIALIDRAAPGDQQAQFVDDLVDRLENDGVFIARWYFDGDPRVCYPKSPAERPARLSRLIDKYPDHRLLLFVDADKLFSPITGRPAGWTESLGAWSERTLVTPEVAGQWGVHEAMLAEEFAVRHASPAGLLDSTHVGRDLRPTTGTIPPTFPPALRRDPVRWIQDVAVARAEVDSAIAELRAYLDGAGFYWLAACAVSPAMNWRLTLNLGYALTGADGNPLLEGERLLALARLPWFRHATMPDWMRERLIDTLSPQQEGEIRQAFRSLLAGAVHGTGDVNDLRIAKDESGIGAKLMTRVFSRLRKDAPADHELNDYLFVSFMSQSKTDRLRVRVGRALDTLLRRGTRKPRRRRKVNWNYVGTALAVAAVVLMRTLPTIVSIAPRELNQLWSSIPPKYAGMPIQRIAGIALPLFTDTLVTPPPPASQAELASSVSGPTTVAASDTFSYRISIRNLGTDSAGSFMVVMQLPDSLHVVGASNGGVPGGGAVRWIPSGLRSGESIDYEVTVAAPSCATELTSTLMLTSSVPDLDVTNNTSAIATRVVGSTCGATPAESDPDKARAINAWAAAICPAAQSLARTFPFDRSSGTDASLADVNALLRPGSGMLWQFHDDVLQDVLVLQGSRYVTRPGAGVQPTAQFLDQFNRAAELSRMLYAADGTGPRIDFTIRAQLQDPISEVTVTLAGRTHRFTRTNLQTQVVSWTGRTESAAIRAMIPAGELRVADAPPSPWSPFFLFSQARVFPGNPTFAEYDGGFVYAAATEQPVRLELTFQNGVPFGRADLGQFSCSSNTDFVR